MSGRKRDDLALVLFLLVVTGALVAGAIAAVTTGGVS